MQRSTDRKLESFKIFPYIAWGLIILFIFFVYRLIVNLNETATELDGQSTSLEDKARASAKDLKKMDFGQ